MTWEEKLEALNAICDHSLIMRKPGDWYVSSDLSVIVGTSCFGMYGEGDTPVMAVLDHWEIYSKVAHPKYIIDGQGNRYRWNKYMWIHVEK